MLPDDPPRGGPGPVRPPLWPSEGEAPELTQLEKLKMAFDDGTIAIRMPSTNGLPPIVEIRNHYLTLPTSRSLSSSSY
jgi:hypothetical protein